MLNKHSTCIQRVRIDTQTSTAVSSANSVIQLQRAHWPKSHTRKEQWHPLPSRLRRGMETITGIDLKPVKVFYNSSKPAQVKAHAYAQGDSIYLAPNQQHHLPHELGHIIQQAMGMVEPTMEIDGVAINDDPELEQQATDLGNLALNLY
ncbi:eCIS core domain-containing protein [Oceanospirillum sediminis]|uniref:DUF4157 domain-containing protein n=1 Tax=Oceanospirillum sediminis TaxID=2760088 RepID=A0A839INC3_9GAMM|nr:DUF4157 domain-containing protein [Oceanospirillum sediminis]MBB1486725.1 DUF4157 domain-containing protein [Oceanospirillum sediminis]